MTQFFKYNVLRQFNFAFVGHVEDLFNSEDTEVTLMDGRKCIVKSSDRPAFHEAFDLYKKRTAPVPHLPAVNPKDKST